MKNTIKCPHCGKEFEATDGLSSHALEEAKKEIELQIRTDLSNKSKLQVLELENQLKEQKSKNEEFIKNEIELREKARKLEDDKREFELVKQRELDKERESIRVRAQEEQSEKDKYKFDEYEKKLKDMQNLNEEMARKGALTSQQLQGEVGELALEDELRSLFVNDDISEVKKGELGGDVRQIVKTQRGNTCGMILWERKRTKTWKEEWVNKLKGDMRRDGAHIGVIVTDVLPKDFKKEIGERSGIWIALPKSVEPLAKLLWQRLYEVAKEKSVALNKQTKSEELYDLVTNQEFVERIKRMWDIYMEMKNQITKERFAYEKIWKQREMSVDELLIGVSRIYGGIKQIAGTAMPDVSGLELDSGV